MTRKEADKLEIGQILVSISSRIRPVGLPIMQIIRVERSKIVSYPWNYIKPLIEVTVECSQANTTCCRLKPNSSLEPIIDLVWYE